MRINTYAHKWNNFTSGDFSREVLKFVKMNGDFSREVLKFVKFSNQKTRVYDNS
jgi:hypothetical protein